MASSPAKGSPGLESRPRGKHSGRLLLRMPKELHGELAQAAAQEGVSLNQFISTTLAKAVGWGEHVPPRGEVEPSVPTSPNRSQSPQPAEADDAGRTRVGGNRLMVALAANFVIVLVAAAIALGMLIAAWRG